MAERDGKALCHKFFLLFCKNLLKYDDICAIIHWILNYNNLIKSGGVTGTVKPGNLRKRKVLNPER